MTVKTLIFMAAFWLNMTDSRIAMHDKRIEMRYRVVPVLRRRAQ